MIECGNKKCKFRWWHATCASFLKPNLNQPNLKEIKGMIRPSTPTYHTQPSTIPTTSSKATEVIRCHLHPHETRMTSCRTTVPVKPRLRHLNAVQHHVRRHRCACGGFKRIYQRVQRSSLCTTAADLFQSNERLQAHNAYISYHIEFYFVRCDR